MKAMKIDKIQEAVQFLSEHPEAKIVAGGSDLIPRINQGIESQEMLLFLGHIPEMSGVKVGPKGDVFIGALTKLADISRESLLEKYTSLVQAASKVASPQIRNQATLGGNILQENRCMYFNQSVRWSRVERCFKLGGDQCYQYKKSPECVALFQSDLAPVLISFDAVACLQGREGYRELPVAELYLKAGKKNIAHDEILTGVKIPAQTEKWHSVYVRKTIRGSFDFPLLSCAVLVRENEGRISGAKIVMGAAGVMPRVVAEAVEILSGKILNDLGDLAPEIEKAIRKYVAPFRDTRVNAAVRRQMGETVFRQAISVISANK